MLLGLLVVLVVVVFCSFLVLRVLTVNSKPPGSPWLSVTSYRQRTPAFLAPTQIACCSAP